MKKKGLILIPFLTGYGGTETVINNLLNEYNKEKDRYNINLKLYSFGGFINGYWLNYPNVKIFQFPKERYIRELKYLFLLPFLILYSIIKEKPNFIISTNPIIWTIAKLCSKVILHKNIKVIAWYHYSYKLKPVNFYCLKKPDHFFTISKSGKQELENLGIKKNYISVVYNPIIPTKKIINHSHDCNEFIYIGRIEYDGQKNISELFKALGLLRNKSWNLRVYGTGPGKYKLIRLSKRLHISNNIEWMGFIEQPLNKVKYADALVLTSSYEGFSMVLAEAMSRGLYVISSNCPSGPSELINKYSGNLYKLGNIHQLARLLNEVLNGKKIFNPYNIKKSMSKFYVKNYLQNFISKLMKIIN